MPLARYFQLLETSSLAKAITHTSWLWPAVESVHVATMVVLVASITTFDLRLMGLVLPRLRVSELSRRLMPATWGAFGIMVLTGITLFIPSASRKYWPNPSFRIKLILIVLAGINMAVFQLTINRSVSKWDEAASPPPLAKALGSLSVLLWASVVVAGRLIGFF